MFSIAVEMKWDICEMDVTAAFLQARFQREVYVRPPHEEGTRGVLWKLRLRRMGWPTLAAFGILLRIPLCGTSSKMAKSKLENTLYFRHQDGQLRFVPDFAKVGQLIYMLVSLATS